ncbi:MAG: hypothetical protein F6J95_008965 [Leptolyngbya sp. SIO1E4]|nr:hypothetical protein [Leptolyngbya sp. SIO1E4]
MTAYPDAQTQAPSFNKAWRSLANSRFWALTLLAIGTASNSIYAHAPLAAFATVSGVTLSRQRAIAIAVLIWLVNQVIGFGLRGYPLTVVAFTWGALMGLGTLLVTVGASWRPAFSRSTGAGHFGWMAIATLGGFVLYQGIIMLALPGLTEGHSMGWDIVGRLFLQQLTWVGAIALGHGLLLWRMLAATH